VRLFLLFVLYLFILNEIRDHRWPALALGLGAALQSLVAVGQFVTRSPLGLFALGELELYTSSPGASVIEVGTQRWLRAYGLSPSPNILGGFLVLGLLAWMGLAMASRARESRVWLGLVALVAAGLICTFSRSAWLGLAVGSFVTGMLLWPSATKRFKPVFWCWVAAGLVVGCLFLIGYPQLFTARLFPSMSASASASSLEKLNLSMRSTYEQVAWDLLGRSPLGGVGVGNFGLAASLQTPPAWGERSHQPVHNALLLLTAELGLIGGAVWLIAWICSSLAIWQNRGRIRQDPWLLAWSGAIIAVGALSNFDHYLFTYQQGRLLLWVTFGLWASAARGKLVCRWPAGAEPDTCLLPRRTSHRDWRGFALTVVFLVAAGVCIHTMLILPRGHFLWDPSGFAWRAWEALRSLRAGQWMDLTHSLLQQPTYPPLHTLMLSGGFAVFGDSATVARLSSLVGFLMATGLVYWLGWEFAPSPNTGALTGGILVALTMSAPTLVYLASDVQLEAAGLLLTMAAMLCACRVPYCKRWSKRRKWLATTGLLSTATFFLKYNYGLPVLIGVWGASLLEGGGWQERRRPLVVLACTTLLPIALWFGTGGRKIEAFVDFAVNRTSGLSWWQGLLFYPGALLREYASHWLLGCAILLAFGLTLVRCHERDYRARVVLLTAIAGLMLAVLHPYKQARFIYTIVPLVLLPAAVWGTRAVQWCKEWTRRPGNSRRRQMGAAVLVAALLALNLLCVLSSLRRYQDGENERLNFDASAQTAVAGMLTFLENHADAAQGVLVNGYFNEVSEALLRWTWRDRAEDKPLLVYGFPFAGRAGRQRNEMGDSLTYVLELEQALDQHHPQLVVSIAVRPNSAFYTADYEAWNAWQEGYDAAMRHHPHLELVDQAYFDQRGVQVSIYRFAP
jgi:4-amino-4-deoxy-L-arabinose transferase-like glycosyltransferase/O-antigen ligase